MNWANPQIAKMAHCAVFGSRCLTVDLQTVASWPGRYPNYSFHHLFCYKDSLIEGLVDRYMKLSEIKFIKENVVDLKITVVQNNYLLSLIKSIIKERIHEIYYASSNKDNWV